MKNKFNPFIVNGFKVEEQCHDNSFYVRFTDEDIDDLAKYAFDMGYSLEPVAMTSDVEHPMRFKILSKANPAVYGWISKVIEKIDDSWQDVFLYGFYRHGSFRNKYPITFNVQSRMMRGVIKHNSEINPRQQVYFRTLFGILDLEQEVKPLDFIFSWLWSIKIQHV
jgi:hypothetical protein